MVPTTINATTNGTIAPTTDPTNCDYTGYCINGASCVAHDIAFKICTCLHGFEGPRCEKITLVLDFSHDKNPEDTEWKNSIAVWISVACLVAIFTLAIIFFTWRACSNNERRRRWKKWQRSTRSSRDTMESFTIANTDQSRDHKHWSFGFSLFKKNKAPKPSDCENQRDQKCHNPETTTKAIPLPSSNTCNMAEGQVAIYVNKEKISVYTHPSLDDSKPKTEPSSAPLPPSSYKDNDTKGKSRHNAETSQQGYVNETLDV